MDGTRGFITTLTDMPRRKQREPRRAPVYEHGEESSVQHSTAGEEDNDRHVEEETSERPTSKDKDDKESDNTSSNSSQNSPASVLSNQDVELESHLSDCSERLSDFKTSPSGSQKYTENHSSTLKDDMHSSLEKMRAVYSNFLSDSYRSKIGEDLKVANTGSKTNCDSANRSTKSEFDWHQDALSKSLQQTLSPKLVSKPHLFRSVHLYRQSGRASGAAFTGASRFRCKDCSAAYDTLVELTVHMNKSGHYQDDNHNKQSTASTSSSKNRKRNLQNMEGKEDAQKVLKCMFCGHSFNSLQDLSVHMIKTKHYQKVPLKEPIPVITPRLIPPAKKRAFEILRPCSPDSTTEASGYSEAQRSPGLVNTPNNRYGYQNGASYTWQFETCKSQILKCMECGSSHDTLQQLTSHMMVTGHFIKVTNSASKKGKHLTLNPVAVEKMQTLAEATVNDLEESNVSPKRTTSGDSERTTQPSPDKAEKNGDKQEKEEQKVTDAGFKYPYLREEDLEESSGGGDILKSLANTVASAINKAQTGTPSWSAYPSIHAAYQLSGVMKTTPPPIQLKPSLNHRPFYQGLHGLEGFHGHHNSDTYKERDGASVENDDDSDCQDDDSSSLKLGADCVSEENDPVKGKLSPAFSDRGKSPSPPSSNRHSSSPEFFSRSQKVLSGNPLSALQSVLNHHLGKANKPRSKSVLSHCTQSQFAKLSRGLKKPVTTVSTAAAIRASDSFMYTSEEQPIDLTKNKHSKRNSSVSLHPSTSVPQKHALSDIADMVKVLPKAITPKPSVPLRMPAMKLETDVRRFEDVSSEIYLIHKRKGRQSNWNPQHLLILQAQFASSLFQTSEGKYLLSDLGPQERMHISKFTGLSMTTISHWLANVKYQLRKTGGTKFLKNMDTGHPVFYCNDCASQFRTPSAFISHLENHLGFQIKDMQKLPVEHLTKVTEPELSKAIKSSRPTDPQITEETDSKFKCKLCSRTFVSNHAIKLHLSKTHSKSPENHSQFVEMDTE